MSGIPGHTVILVSGTKKGFEKSFHMMKQLVEQLGLPIADKDALLKQLEDWEKKGNDKCCNRKSFLFSAKE